jgi:hypothetical protein
MASPKGKLFFDWLNNYFILKKNTLPYMSN